MTTISANQNRTIKILTLSQQIDRLSLERYTAMLSDDLATVDARTVEIEDAFFLAEIEGVSRAEIHAVSGF